MSKENQQPQLLIKQPTTKDKQNNSIKKYRPSIKTGGIASLYNTPNWDDPGTKNDPSTKTEDMCEEAANYYVWLFQEKQAHNPEIVLDKLREKQLTEIDKEFLDKKISKAECRQVMRSMADDKSPGSDKLPAEFYKLYETLILDNYHDMIEEACEYGYLPEDTTEGTIALIYKNKGGPRDMRNYRPITLLQVDYKIYAKILVARLKRKSPT
jgi:hypothetical protein